jgi:hypothetical protein
MLYLINKSMEKTEIKVKKKSGGARPGAGRKPGSKSHITIEGLLNQVQAQSNGQDYEQLLIQDFLNARYSDDKQLLLKYHNLILNKVMNSLAKIEVTDSADAVETKKQAFADALAKLAGVSTNAK